MDNIFLQILIFAYAGVGIIATIGYIPTIKDLLINKRMSANINSYLIWSFCSGVAFLYSLFVLPDFLFRVVSGLNFLCCTLILFLSIYLSFSRKFK